MKNKIGSIIVVGLIICAFQNCSKVGFTVADKSETGLQAVTSIPVTPPAPVAGPVVCNPFGGSTATPAGGSAPASTQGLIADGVNYVDTTKLASGQTPLSVVNNSVEGFFDPTNLEVGHFDAKMILSDLNFPNMYFSTGFTDSSGHSLTDASGQLLIQYFAFRAKSDFVSGKWAPGDYQIAILSDDGSQLTMTGGQANGSDLLINNDGAHSLRMGCTQSVLHISANSQIPLTFDYFQGPPITIGFLMLYRPVAVAGTMQEPLCGQGGSGDSYFFLDHTSQNQPISPPLAQAPYLQLVGAFNATSGSGGWQVVEAEHFILPGNMQNTCTSP